MIYTKISRNAGFVPGRWFFKSVPSFGGVLHFFFHPHVVKMGFCSGSISDRARCRCTEKVRIRLGVKDARVLGVEIPVVDRGTFDLGGFKNRKSVGRDSSTNGTGLVGVLHVSDLQVAVFYISRSVVKNHPDTCLAD